MATFLAADLNFRSIERPYQSTQEALDTEWQRHIHSFRLSLSSLSEASGYRRISC